MTENEAPLARPGDVLLAYGLLSRMPMPRTAASRGARAAWAYPLVGIGIGTLAALGGAVALALGLPAPLAALVTLATLVATTGAMHEDGLADTADGLWGGWTRERRLEIMRDSRIGTYGVIALVLALGARGAALWLLFEAGTGVAAVAILTAAALSRATMPALMAALPHAREDGLSKRVGAVSRATAALAIGIGALTALLLTGWGAIGAMLWAGAAAFAVGLVARRKIGGQTGDILGATQQLAEIAVLFSLVA